VFKKRRWFSGGRIDSDEGFSVRLGRDAVAYWEGSRRMLITADVGAGKVYVFTETIGRWDDDSSHTVNDEERQRIADNLRRAFESQGFSVALL